MKKFLCIGPHCWGKGETPNDAKKVADKECPTYNRPMKAWRMYLVGEGTVVTGMGDFTFPIDTPTPVELYCVFDGKQYPPGTERPKKGK